MKPKLDEFAYYQWSHSNLAPVIREALDKLQEPSKSKMHNQPPFTIEECRDDWRRDDESKGHFFTDDEYDDRFRQLLEDGEILLVEGVR
jgi:hypothetical protein